MTENEPQPGLTKEQMASELAQTRVSRRTFGILYLAGVAALGTGLAKYPKHEDFTREGAVIGSAVTTATLLALTEHEFARDPEKFNQPLLKTSLRSGIFMLGLPIGAALGAVTGFTIRKENGHIEPRF